MADSELVTQRERSKQIDRYLKNEKKKYNDYVKNTMKLLLVGRYHDEDQDSFPVTG